MWEGHEEVGEKAAHLKQTLERADYLTNQLVTLLDSFDRRINELSVQIAPIHEFTQQLTLRNNSNLFHFILFYFI